mmetsp:Transcript_7418/g.16810  ORF Transcript_7418/g.16810 Transcript_7418/m.16810 type:complete len:230 (+) Transcript_7418:227-916(+)
MRPQPQRWPSSLEMQVAYEGVAMTERRSLGSCPRRRSPFHFPTPRVFSVKNLLQGTRARSLTRLQMDPPARSLENKATGTTLRLASSSVVVTMNSPFHSITTKVFPCQPILSNVIPPCNLQILPQMACPTLHPGLPSILSPTRFMKPQDLRATLSTSILVAIHPWAYLTAHTTILTFTPSLPRSGRSGPVPNHLELPSVLLKFKRQPADEPFSTLRLSSVLITPCPICP